MLVSVIPLRWAFTVNYRRFLATGENSVPASEAVATVAGFMLLAVGIGTFVVDVVARLL